MKPMESKYYAAAKNISELINIKTINTLMYMYILTI